MLRAVGRLARWTQRHGLAPALVLILLLTAVTLSALPSRPLARAATPSFTNLHDLIPGFDYLTWYTAETGYGFDSTFNWFGAYAIVPDGDSLYVGFGTSSPAARDGALLARYTTAGGLTRLGPAPDPPLHEQGFIDMHLAGGKLYVPGIDPCCGDILSDNGAEGSWGNYPDCAAYDDGSWCDGHQWDWGNAYVYDIAGDTLIKHRNQPDTLHTFAHWYDAATGTLYAASSGLHCCTPPPDQVDEDWSGWVFGSGNDGDDWTLLADDAGSRVPGKEEQGDSVGTYRVYDIIGFNGKLYIQWADILEAPNGSTSLDCGLASSADGGETWTRLPGVTVRCARRIEVIDGMLVAAMAAADGLVLVDSSDAVTTRTFPGFKLGGWAFNFIAADPAGNVYVVADHGRVYRTSDLTGNSWELLVAGDYEFSAIAFWPAEDALILADNGETRTATAAGISGRLWRIPAAASAVSVPVPPQPAALPTGILDWSDVPDATGYRVYAGANPYLSANQYSFYTAVAASQTALTGFGDPQHNHFFLVRAVGPDGLSPVSGRVGEFDFAIVPGGG